MVLSGRIWQDRAMLIICSGADSYRALQKVKELEAAYKAKFDKEGLSVETCPVGQSPVVFLQQRIGVGSLFAQRSFLRVSNLLDVKASEKKILKQLLAKQDEYTIIVDTEDAHLTTKEVDGFTDIPGLVRYDFPQQKGAHFLKWLKDQAVFLQVTDSAIIEAIAKIFDGDSWAAMNALIPVSCGYTLNEYTEVFDQTFVTIERILKQDVKRFSSHNNDNDASLLTLLLQQASQAERIKAQDTQGIHPYALTKLKQLGTHSSEVLLRAIEAQALVRSGFATEEELISLQ